MNKENAMNNLIKDIRTTKATTNMQMFKENIYDYTIEELDTVLSEINEHFYFGQHGVDDMKWFNLKQTIQELNNLNKK